MPRGVQADFSYKNTERLGVYEASWPGGQRGFAVNLLDPEESNIQPRDEVGIGAQRLSPGQLRRQTHETWKWGVLVSLVLLVLEWAIHQRCIFF